MKFLFWFLMLVAAAFVLTAMIPVLTLGLALLICFGGFFIWLLPILIIAVSDKPTGGEKLAWILAIIFLSWFAWIFYFLLAPIKEKPSYRREYRYD
jgi:hypothetical protein